MTSLVLDSWALLAFFEDEPAAVEVETILIQSIEGRVGLFMSVINWTEVYYATMRRISQSAAEQKAREIMELNIRLVGVAKDLAVARQAAIYKATHHLALADAFAAALAWNLKAKLVTGDPEFRQLEKEIGVQWLS